MFHPVFGEMLWNVLGLMAVFLVFVLKWSYWTERKRERDVLLRRAQAKEEYLKILDEPAPAAAGAPPEAGTTSGLLRPHFKIFRSEFLVLTLTAVAVLMPLRTKINARTSTSASPAALGGPGSSAATPVDRAADLSTFQDLDPNMAPALSQQAANVDPVEAYLTAARSSADCSQPIQFSDCPAEPGQGSDLVSPPQVDFSGLRRASREG